MQSCCLQLHYNRSTLIMLQTYNDMDYITMFQSPVLERRSDCVNHKCYDGPLSGPASSVRILSFLSMKQNHTVGIILLDMQPRQRQCWVVESNYRRSNKAGGRNMEKVFFGGWKVVGFVNGGLSSFFLSVAHEGIQEWDLTISLNSEFWGRPYMVINQLMGRKINSHWLWALIFIRLYKDKDWLSTSAVKMWGSSAGLWQTSRTRRSKVMRKQVRNQELSYYEVQRFQRIVSFFSKNGVEWDDLLRTTALLRKARRTAAHGTEEEKSKTDRENARKRC